VKIILFANTDWYLYNFRLSLAKALRDQGHEVILLSPNGGYGDRLTQMGFRWVVFPLSRRGMNPVRELITVGRLARFYRREHPDLVHHFTVKCVLYGSFAAWLANVHAIINSITGLGFIFIEENKLWVIVLRQVVKFLYRILLSDRQNTRVIFQNREDMSLFLQKKLTSKERAYLIPGSGVDTAHYVPSPEPEGVPLVILPGRLLWDKGVGEFVQAAQALRKEGVNARFALVGDSDSANPGGVPPGQLETWRNEGWVEWWGWQEDMLDVLRKAHIVCLPSYREGVPRSLLEAGACGRPVITTDVPGCRDVVRQGENGLLVPAKDVAALTDALRMLIYNIDLRAQLGACGRKIAVEEYSVERVNAETLKVYQKT
jgi:glycosyltransferase involved in cell wall biosynthesis